MSVTCDGANALTEIGASGDAAAGSLVAFVLQADGAAYADAVVVLEAGGNRWEQRTDWSGCAAFEHSAIAGPIAVHAFQPLGAPSPAAQSLVGYDREVVTFVLPYEQPRPRERPTAQVSGTIPNLEVLGATTASTARMASVVTYLETLPRAGTPFYLNTVVDGAGYDFPEYTLKIHANEAATLFAFGRLYSTDNVYHPVTHLGILPGVMLAPDEVRTGQEIVLDYELTERVVVTFNGGPTLDETGADLWLMLDGGGAVALPGGFLSFGGDALPDTVEVAAPPRTGLVAGATYRASVSSYEFDSGWHWSVSNVGPGPTIDLPAAPAFPANFRMNGRTLQVDLDPGTRDFAAIAAFDGSPPHGPLLWHVRKKAPGATLSFTFPEAPVGVESPTAGWFTVSADGVVGTVRARARAGSAGSL